MHAIRKQAFDSPKNRMHHDWVTITKTNRYRLILFGFHLDSDTSIEIYFTDIEDAQYPRSIDITGLSGLHSVSFTKIYVDDESIGRYLITNGGSTGMYFVDLDQIVIFTYLLENASLAPSENWMDDRGFSENNSGYYVINS